MRFFNVYGIGQNLLDLKQGMVSIFVSMALQQGHISVRGSLDRTRSFIHITDLISAMMLLSDRKSMSSFDRCMIFNVSSNIETTVRELVQLISSYTSATFSDTGEVTPLDQFNASADISRICETVGWQPTIALQDGLQEMLQWARASIIKNL